MAIDDSAGPPLRMTQGREKKTIANDRNIGHNSTYCFSFPMREGARDEKRRGRKGADKGQKMKDERVGKMVERLNR